MFFAGLQPARNYKKPIFSFVRVPLEGTAMMQGSCNNVQAPYSLIYKEIISTTPTPPYCNEGPQPSPQTPQPSPGQGLNLKSSETKLFRLFWYRGTRDDFFDGSTEKRDER